MTSKRRRSQGKVTNRGDKPRHTNDPVLVSTKSKHNIKCNKAVIPVISAGEPLPASLCTSPPPTNVRCSRYDMRECVFKRTRSSSKPKRMLT